MGVDNRYFSNRFVMTNIIIRNIMISFDYNLFYKKWINDEINQLDDLKQFN